MKNLVGIILFAVSVLAQAQATQYTAQATIPGYVTNTTPLRGYISQGHENDVVTVAFAAPVNTPYSYNGGRWNNSPPVFPKAYQQAYPQTNQQAYPNRYGN